MNEKLHAAFADATHRIHGFQVRGSDRRGNQGSGQVYKGPERRGTLVLRRRHTDMEADNNNRLSAR